jgi:effector-binding domain-containing protein
MPLSPAALGMDPADADVVVKDVPAETVARCTYHGFPDELASAIAVLFAWMDEQDLQRTDLMHRQVYHETPPGQPGAWVVEIQVPVRPA